MVAPRPRPDLTPYWATGMALTLALVVNAYRGQKLWVWYSLVGLVGYAVLAVAVHRFRWRVPALAVWCGGLALVLHYLGGSVEGVQEFLAGSVVSRVFPYWDSGLHFVGGAAVAVAAYAILPAASTTVHSMGRTFLAICVANFAGVLIELYEFGGSALFGTIPPSYYTNTIVDLYFNVLGSALGATTYARMAARPQAPGEPSPQSSPGPE